MSDPDATAKPWYRRRRWWIMGAAGLILIIAAVTAGGAGHNSVSTSTGSSAGSSTRPNASGTTAAPTTTEEDDLGGSGAPTVVGSVVAAGSGRTAGPSACRSGDPLANVYHPNRLTVVKPCMTVSGTVMSVTPEPDGDVHFDIALDPQYATLLKPANYSGQHGRLVDEIVPADQPACSPGQPPRQSSGTYDYGVCTGADEPTPAVGSHVYVTGPYVLDEDHGGWAEIHPVWAVSTAAARR